MKMRRFLSLLLAVCMVSAMVSVPVRTEAAAATGERWLYMNASLPLNYDPASGASSIDSSIMFNVYDALTFPDVDGTVLPHVATEWTAADDGMSWEFKIRDGIKFHNGDVLDAEDCAFSVNRVLAIGEGYTYLWADFLESAEAVDASTLKINMKKPYAVLPATLVRLPIVNKDLVMENIDSSVDTYGEFGDYGKGWLSTNDAGSGPFETQEISITDYVTCKRFDGYWQEFGTNPPDGFTVRAINEGATIMTMMSNNELSITDEWETQETLKQLDEIEGVDVAMINSGAIMCLEMNTKKAPTDDIHVRKALAYLYDYDTATTYIYPGTTKGGGPVSSAYEGSISAELNEYSYNIDKAKEELAQSKYADTIGDYTIDVEYSADVKDEEPLCLLLQQAAAQVGINMTITATPWSTLIANAATQESTACITVMAPSDSFSEAGAVLNLLYNSANAGTFNYFHWMLDDKLDQMIIDSLAEQDHDARMAKYAEAQKYISEQCPVIWTLEWPEERAYHSDQFKWPEAEAEKNAPILGRSLYLKNIEFYN